MKYLRKGILVLSAVFVCGSYAGTAHAIPAFSRQHKVECTTCHTIYPELNEYGEAFLKNSYVYTHPKKQGEKTVASTGTGAGSEPALPVKPGTQVSETSGSGQSAKSEGILLAAIPELIPVSVTATLSASYNENAPNNDDLDFSTRAVTLQSGGNFREKFGFFGKYMAYSEGVYNPASGNSLAGNANVPRNNATDLKELFLAWRRPLDLPFTIKIGRLIPKLSLWKSSNKISVSSFATHSYTVGDSPFTIDSPEDGIEVNSVIAGRLFAAAGVVDRNGQKDSEVYGHLSVKMGGADFIGTEPEIDFDNDSVWDFLSLTLGAYGYSGRNANIVGGVAQYFNDYYRLGLDLDLIYKKFRLKAGCVHGRDTNPYFTSVKDNINSLVVSTEAEYMFETNVIAAVRYEYISDQNHIAERHIYAPYLAYSPLQNIRIVLEYRHEDYVSSEMRDNKIGNLGVSFSF